MRTAVADAMKTLLAIAIGGALGALLRYWMSSGVYALTGRDFPYGTLAVNVIGSLIMGFVYIWLLERTLGGAGIRAFLLIGLLGAFTTFSTFSIETLYLIEEGEQLKALINIVVSVVVCIFACWVGMVVGRQL